MKLSTTIMAAVAAAAASCAIIAPASSASAATVFESYDYSFGDAFYDAADLQVLNDSGSAYTDVQISGGSAGGFTDFGPLAAGQSVHFYLGDNENDFAGSQGTALVTIVTGGHTYSGSFTDVLGDPDHEVPRTFLGELATGGAVPEPTTWSLMLLGFGGLGATLRATRKRAAAVTA